ncbi:Short-chain dehydrogenase reductase SDR [Fusarium albosuccineum]|uniref:Short-chain dehydrogenase reductase SDR n=1 Tax=Fusarium albosuccineum TaxID=1237068 RepID=A0A8H4P4D3_9HYPO|nr:Short-chain dehydrogenase reductase SDR [Fusarium albosuccineum]
MASYVITGASKGIGREFVRQLSQNPSNTVFAIVRDPEAAKAKLVSNDNVHIIKGDVTDPASILAAASQVSDISNGKLDVLIHNSNAVDFQTFELLPSQIPFDVEATKKFYELPFATNIYGGIWTTNAFLPLIEKGTVKKIIHISSGMADTDLILGSGLPFSVAYAVAKAGVNVQIAKYAAELAPKGIKTLALSPGWVDTYEGPLPKPAEMVQGVESLKQLFLKYDPELNGQISPEESVRDQLHVIGKLDEKMSGSFLSQRGVRGKY